MDSCRTVKTVFERHNEVTAPQLPFTHCQLSIFFLSLFSRCERTARHGLVDFYGGCERVLSPSKNSCFPLVSTLFCGSL